MKEITVLRNQGCIDEVVMFGNTWIIPEDAKKPNDARIKFRKYYRKKRRVTYSV